uniref:Uncharacterized protein n=1 Tax=Amphimedon queenslandica TaxID=400682 RepID=A0A1X7UUL2_AMPQE
MHGFITIRVVICGLIYYVCMKFMKSFSVATLIIKIGM